MKPNLTSRLARLEEQRNPTQAVIVTCRHPGAWP